jgi:vitamin B12 transporter
MKVLRCSRPPILKCVRELTTLNSSAQPATPVILSGAARQFIRYMVEGRGAEGSRRCLVSRCGIKAASSGSFDSPSRTLGLAQVDSGRACRLQRRFFPARSGCVALSLRTLLVLVLSMTCFTSSAAADRGSSIHGVVSDPLGAVVSEATVELLQGSRQAATTTTDRGGNYRFSNVVPGHYTVRARATGFASQQSEVVYVGAGNEAGVDVVLKIGTISQQIVVSATGTRTPESKVGASVSVLTADQFLNRLDVLEPLRLVPGVQMEQTGQRGTVGSMWVRGGNSSANKVLLDGVPLNDIGGVVNFGTLAAAAVDQIEVLRGPNSVLFGPDAMAGVVSLTTRRGTTPLPELSYAFDAGNFNSLRNDVSLGGAFRRLDYLGEFSRFDTGNSIPNNTFHNATYVANFGLAINAATELRATGRYTTTALGQPNQIEFFGIPDDSFERDQDGYLSVTFSNQTTVRWHNLVRYAATRLRLQDVNPSPTGIPFDPFPGFDSGPNFLGLPVTIHGANGFRATGQAILDFAGKYPSSSSSSSKRDSVYVQSDYSLNPHVLALAAFRYENERGFTLSSFGKTPASRGNYSYIAEVQASLGARAYLTLGGSVENNAVFGVTAVPRVSLAYYLIRPRTNGFLNGTKLKFNYGQGTKEPSIFEATSSLFDLLSHASNGAQLIAQFNLAPIAAERSRSYDVGFEQLAWNGRAKIAATFFHNRFTNQIEFVPSTALAVLGVPPAVVAQAGFGATVNSGDTRALGAETELEFALGYGFTARAAYTYLDAVVERSFTSDAFSCAQPGQLFCAFNPALPTIPIGVFSPLQGNRPFRRAPHAGSFSLGYSRPKFTLDLSGLLISRRDDSTFLSDAFFGNTMLLPNRNLDPSYQKLDLSGRYRVNRRLTFYSVVENLLSQHHDQIIGFPAPPLTFRAGFRVTLGGESWK